jgi:hypothetical protein
MQDLCLSFQDEAEALSILYTLIPAEYEINENNEPTKIIKTESYLLPNYQNISIIGTVYQKEPIPIPENFEPIPYPSPNFGVNVRLLDDEDIEPLRQYIVKPRKPIRVWA